MDAKQIRQLGPKLGIYIDQFRDCFGRSEPADNFGVYVFGQLSDLQRKSIEPIAKNAGVRPRTLQQFLALADWDDQLASDRVEQIIGDQHADPMSIGIVDETGHAKKGDKTPGVKHQYCGASGKVDNCIVTVHISYVAGGFQTLLPGELFLPEDWSNDRKRCGDAGIPDQMVHQRKWQIALVLRDRAVANGILFAWFGGDAGYGEVPAFHFALDDRGQRYVLEVPSNFLAWLRQPELLRKQPGGRSGQKPRLKAKDRPTIEVRNMLRYCQAFRDQQWTKFHIKDSTAGPEVWEAKAARIYLKRDGLPTRPHWLIVARNVLVPEEVKYFVSNAPAGTPLEVMLHVAFSRFAVEQCFEVAKGDLGLSHCEVRNYRSLKRHLILTAVSQLFLAEVKQDWRKKNPEPDGLPDPLGDLGRDPLTVADRQSPNAYPATPGYNHHGDPTRQCQGRTQPHQDPVSSVA